MALELADVPVRPITVDEALRMLDAGVFEEPNRLELLRGVLVEKPVKSAAHEYAKARLIRWLWELGPDAVRFESPIVMPDGISMPEPDLAVGHLGTRDEHPVTAELVIEVAKTSFKLDTTIKAVLYASAEVPEYWVVDVSRSRVIVFRDPEPAAYRTRTTHAAPETLRPRSIEITPLELGTLFA